MNNENNNLGNQIPINNQAGNNGQFTNQSFAQPQAIQSQYNNQGNSQQSMYNSQVNIPSQMTRNFNQYPNQKKSDNNLFIIIGICIAVALAIIILLIVLIGNDKNENRNEYENNNNINNDVSNEQPNTPVVETQSYKGFNFKKLSGYQYQVKNINGVDMLFIDSGQNVFLLTITKADFNSFKLNYKNGISNSLKKIIIGQIKLQSYSNVEVATYEVNYIGRNAIYFILSSSNQSYCFEGFSVPYASDGTFNYSTINELVKLTSNFEYTGNFTNYSSEFGIDINIDLENLKR